MEKLDEIGKKVDEMHIVIAGQPQYGQPGLKDTLENLDGRIAKVEKGQTKKLVMSASIGGALGVLFPKAILAKIATFFSYLNPF